MKDIIWLSDLHLDAVKEEHRVKFYTRLHKANGARVVISGDISDARNLSRHLSELAEACAPRPLYFVLGNHDYFGSSFTRVHDMVSSLCKKHSNLHHLGHGEIIPLGDHEALIGHGGWADGRAGHGVKSKARNPDFWSIEDFMGRDWKSCYEFMAARGRESGSYFEKLLPRALSSHCHVWVVTHVPPFTQAASWNGKLCNYDFQPHYTNVSLGFTLWEMSKVFPSATMTILAGHTHSEANLLLRPNLRIRVAAARPGIPKYELI